MRVLIKLSILVTLTLAVQRGAQIAAINAAEWRFDCAVVWAQIRGVPIDAPELLDLAEPLIGYVPISNGLPNDIDLLENCY